MSSINNIISVRDVQGTETPSSLSGLDLMDAPELSIRNLANIANEEYVTGMQLAQRKVQQATLLVRNDFMSILAANRVMPQLAERQYTTGEFRAATTFPAEAKERGLTLYRNTRIKGTLRKLYINSIQVYPLADATGAELKIYDDAGGGTVSVYNIDLNANTVNTFRVNYEVKGNFARVLLNGTGIPVASSFLTCFTGCNGTLPNDCAYTRGWYDDKEISGKEGFGINVEFNCSCDYEQLLCDMARTYIGEIVWLKSRVLLLEEHLRTNRLNNWVVYGREETQQYLTDVENQYRDKWRIFADTVPGILQQFKDDCLQCNGVKWVVNV